MKITELKYDEERKCNIYNGLPYPNCKLYEGLEITYTGYERITEEIKSLKNGRHTTAHEYYDCYSFDSEIGPLQYKVSIKTNNKVKDSLNSHKDISGVKYTLKAIIDDSDNVSQIKRMINFKKVTRNPESCK